MEGDHPEWTVSGEAIYAKVSVVKEGNEYKASVGYYSDKECSKEVEKPSITNTYTKPTEGKASLEIQKRVTGEEAPEEIPSIFKFKLEAVT